MCTQCWDLQNENGCWASWHRRKIATTTLKIAPSPSRFPLQSSNTSSKMRSSRRCALSWLRANIWMERSTFWERCIHLCMPIRTWNSSWTSKIISVRTLKWQKIWCFKKSFLMLVPHRMTATSSSPASWLSAKWNSTRQSTNKLWKRSSKDLSKCVQRSSCWWATTSRKKITKTSHSKSSDHTSTKLEASFVVTIIHVWETWLNGWLCPAPAILACAK